MSAIISEPFNGALAKFHDKPSEIGLPPFEMRGRAVLEVGCSTGKELMHAVYAHAAQRCGIDADERSIAVGRERYPHLSLEVACAERMPFPDETFDALLCRTALPYMDIPVALREMHRVMKPGAYLLLTLHDLRMHCGWMGEACRERNLKRFIDCVWMFWPSFWFAAFGTVPKRPWGGRWKSTRETFQTRAGMRWALTKAGFVSATFERTSKHFIVRATKR